VEEVKQAAAEENKAGSPANEPEAGPAEHESTMHVTLTIPEEVKEPLATPSPAPEKTSREGDVHVAPHLPDLIAGIALPVEEEERAKEQRGLDQAIHKLLVVGLVISVALILFGLFLDLTLHREIPTSIPHLAEIFTRVTALRPSGFLSLGLLVLIITPVVRVLGSFLAFVYERDWRYAAITFVVLVVVTLSIVLGRG
jgi:uncharacterized membrane protein